jgi:hypothetical protein
VGDITLQERRKIMGLLINKKSIVGIGEPGGGKTVLIETFPAGTVDFNTDPGGWKSLERVEAKGGRHPKKLKHSPTLREWLKGKEDLQKDEILIIDYSSLSTPMNVGLLTNYDSKQYFDLGQDINALSTLKSGERGIFHFTIDSLTGLQWYVLHGMVNLAGHSLKGTSQYTYGLAIEKIREIIDVCCHVPFDFYLTAHIESEKDEIVGKIQETILLYGKKLPGIVLSMIDDIYYMSVSTMSGKKEYQLETSPGMFLKIIRQRSFDDLPVKIKPNLTELYKGQLSNG